MTKIEQGHQAAPHQHVDPEARHLDAPLLQLNLRDELAALRSADRAGKGHVAKTLAKHPDLRVVLIAFEPGARLERHSAPGRVWIQVLDGELAIRIGAQTAELAQGGLLEIAPTLEHEVEARTQSALLLTIAWPKA